MPIYLLDTDHLTLIQRGESKVSARYLATPREERVASVISFQEQMRGRLAVINKLRSTLTGLSAFTRNTKLLLWAAHVGFRQSCEYEF